MASEVWLLLDSIWQNSYAADGHIGREIGTVMMKLDEVFSSDISAKFVRHVCAHAHAFHGESAVS